MAIFDIYIGIRGQGAYAGRVNYVPSCIDCQEEREDDIRDMVWDVVKHSQTFMEGGSAYHPMVKIEYELDLDELEKGFYPNLVILDNPKPSVTTQIHCSVIYEDQAEMYDYLNGLIWELTGLEWKEIEL